ncbi:helix-turn-helix domain-containing protein [Neorhizobium galegae]
MLCHLSVSHFSRAFKISFGDTPYNYILWRRIELAQRMIAQTDEPLSQVALACGFADQAHLCNVFRKFLGCTPMEWRRLKSSSSPTWSDGCMSLATHSLNRQRA